MTTPNPGTKAPLFTLSTLDGEQKTLADALFKAPLVVLAFFKVSCPVCQLSFPFLERLYQAYPDVPLWGISQDDAADTRKFCNSYAVNMPMLLDEQLAATAEYDLLTVPSIFVVGPDGVVQQDIFGFSKADFEKLNASMAQAAKVEPRPLFTADDDVPALKPG